jgi:lipoprotein-anchoring transpeptidase ErfK/SrfK
LLLAITVLLGVIAELHHAEAGPAVAPAAALPPPTVEAPQPSMRIVPTGVVAATPTPAAANPGSASAAPAAPSGPTPILTTTPPLYGNAPSAPQPAISTASGSTPASPPQFAAVVAPAPPAGAESLDVLDRARADAGAGHLISARATLNDALLAGNLSDAQAAECKQLMSQFNQTLVFSPRRFEDDPYSAAYVVKPGELMANIATTNATTWELLSRINNIEPKKLRSGTTLKILRGPFHAVVDKKSFTMDIYFASPGGKGSMYVTSYKVGLGKDDSTPPGTWMVEPHRKIKNPTYYSPRGEGIIAAGDPKNPLGAFWIGLTGIDGQAVGKQSYGIHGTIDPDSIGKQSSLGCIRLHNDDIALTFELLVEGKSIVVVKG